MQKIRDLTNQRFNNLVGIKYIGKDKQNKSLWLFKCDCGNEKIIRGTNVINGSVKSCGCKAKCCNFDNQSVKHINYNKNLHSKKLHNKKDLYKNNTSGHRGVSIRSDERYCCYICINGKHFNTTKSTLESAIAWRKNMERKIKENW